jgi:hypothetical protein
MNLAFVDGYKLRDLMNDGLGQAIDPVNKKITTKFLEDHGTRGLGN